MAPRYAPGVRIARFTTGEDPQYGVVTGELDEFGQPEPDAVVVALAGDPLYVGLKLLDEEHRLADVRLLAPVLPRSKVVGIGRNYAAHAAEMGNDPPEEPLMFLKPNTSVVGPGDPVIYPPQTRNLHFEGELAVVIGRICRDVPADQATDVIHGYTIGNDVTARDLQKSDVQFTRAKGFDSFCPLGPWIETDLDPDDFAKGRRRADPPQRRPQAGRQHRRPDLRRPHPRRACDQRDDAVARVMSSSPAPRRASARWRSATRSRSPSKGSAHSPTRWRLDDTPRSVAAPTTPRGTGPVLSVTHGVAARRLRPHRAVQLGLRPHHGGTFVFRIEDTDKGRSTEESYDAMLGAMEWLGLDWDEGPGKGGPYAPYRQSERGDLYRDVLARLAESKFTYDCYCTTEEVDARRKASGSKVQGYDGFCRELSEERLAAFLAEGRSPVVRFRMPEGKITWHDLVRGDITFDTQHVPDYALCRANGDPLYTLVNPVDDALMAVTHVLRGEDLLSSTPRQIPLHRALVELGISSVVPEFGHLPFVMGEGNKKLSKRDPESHLFMYRDSGFLPEGLLNYLALLGWAIAADRDVFTLEEMVDAFDIADVNPNPARFDLKKAEAINADHMRMLPIEELTSRVLPFLKSAGVVGDPVSDADAQLLEQAMPLVAERMNKLTEAVPMLGFLFADESSFSLVDDLDDAGRDVVRAAYGALAEVERWSTADIETALREALVEGLALKPRVAFGPVRIAVTGRKVSPPLFESLELLGRDRSLARLRAAAP